MSFSNLGLSAGLLRAIAEQGYTLPTPVQVRSIPPILAGRDVLARAQTGTGKTAGFALPILQSLEDASGPRRHVRCLILAPTRELAAQIQTCIAAYGRYSRLRSTTLFGGVGINPQIAALRAGVDIVVATPGRLLDHMGQRTIDLSRVEVLVLDEADRMLDMGFIRDIRRVLAALPREKQSLLFSATFSPEIKQLAATLLRDPEEIVIAPKQAAADRIEQHVHIVDRARKRQLLAHLIGAGDWRQVLVFTRTKHGANRLASQLEADGLTTAAIHGNKSQGARTKALADFKRGAVRVLVATDIAARGLDIDELPHVVNYELPEVAEDYVHRIGRTGRAGREGAALSLVSAEERDLLRNIEALLKQKLAVIVVPGFEPGRAPAAGEQIQARHAPAANGRRSTRQAPAGNGQRPRHASTGNGQRPARQRAESGDGERRARRPRGGQSNRNGRQKR